MGVIMWEVDREVCMNGIVGKIYLDFDMNNVFCCLVSLEIVDFFIDRINDM